jgi:dihydroorotase-like cyclic amidohydrolase
MSLEVGGDIIAMSPGLYDPHAHPRVFDPITGTPFNEENKYEGKAGIVSYTETALASGITMISAMPNEFFRRVNLELPDGTEIIQYPISNLDRAIAMETALATGSRIRSTFHLGLDRTKALADEGRHLMTGELKHNFATAGNRATALKVFVDVSTGGQNIPVDHIPEVARLWHEAQPGKPVIIHAEDANVGVALDSIFAMPGGKDIPIHIAHVSSEQELTAVILAKQRGQNVTCEATPHHLFADKEAGSQIQGYGCMKPSLKAAKDVKFLWDNLWAIDMFASDCAPHRRSDKEAENPAYGVTNHTVMMQLLLGAVQEGRMTLDDFYARAVVNPRQRFNMPMDDGTLTSVDLSKGYSDSSQLEQELDPRYGHNIFPHLEALGQTFTLKGQLREAWSGRSYVSRNRVGRLALHYASSLDNFVAG